jgi:hypothetical protein
MMVIRARFCLVILDSFVWAFLVTFRKLSELLIVTN